MDSIERPSPDIRFDAVDGYSVLNGLDHMTGLVALVIVVVIGADLYGWLALHKPPRLAILWMPTVAVTMWRRVVTGKTDAGRWPASWYTLFAIYCAIVAGVALVKGPASSDDWWLIAFATVMIALSLLKARRS